MEEKLVEKLLDTVRQKLGEGRNSKKQFNLLRFVTEGKEKTIYNKILAELLNPNGEHGMGGYFLKTFCEQCLPNCPPMESDFTSVRRNYPLQVRGGFQDVDICLDNGSCGIVVIESQVDGCDEGIFEADDDAGYNERKDHIREYKFALEDNFFNSKKPHAVYYLTWTGKKARTAQPTANISWMHTVLPWLKFVTASKEVAAHPDVLISLYQFLELFTARENVMIDFNEYIFKDADTYRAAMKIHRLVEKLQYDGEKIDARLNRNVKSHLRRWRDEHDLTGEIKVDFGAREKYSGAGILMDRSVWLSFKFLDRDYYGAFCGLQALKPMYPDPPLMIDMKDGTATTTSSEWYAGESLQTGFDEDEWFAIMLCDPEAGYAWIASMFDRLLAFYNEWKKDHTPRRD